MEELSNRNSKALSYLNAVESEMMKINATVGEIDKTNKRGAMDTVIMRGLLDILPGSGDVIAAKDSSAFASKAYEDIKKGDIGSAATNLTWSLIAGAGALPALPYLSMVAWHGSPHLFPPTKNNPLGEFDLSKLGTEGYYGGTSFGKGMNVASDERHALHYKGENGTLYKVDIPDKEIENMIDWHKPLNEQSKNIQEALKDIDIPPIQHGADFGNGAKLIKSEENWLLDTGTVRWPLHDIDFKRMYGDELTGEQVYRRLQGSLGSEDAVNKLLLSKGIKGTRFTESGYKDNFVLFDPSIAKIIGRE